MDDLWCCIEPVSTETVNQKKDNKAKLKLILAVETKKVLIVV